MLRLSKYTCQHTVGVLIYSLDDLRTFHRLTITDNYNIQERVDMCIYKYGKTGGIVFNKYLSCFLGSIEIFTKLTSLQSYIIKFHTYTQSLVKQQFSY